MNKMHAVQIRDYGGVECLSLNCIPVPKPGRGEVLVRIACAGVNFMDVYTRRGGYKGLSPYATQVPLTLGMEGCGWVEGAGEGVTGFEVGDRVVFCLALGSYAEFAVISAEKLVLLPDNVTFEAAATGFFQGLTAHYLAYETSRLCAGDICLVYSASGGVAQNLIQILGHMKVVVIAAASSPIKCQAAAGAGAQKITLDSPRAIQDLVNECTGGLGVDVLFDSVGRALFQTSLKALKKKGLLVHYGANSGALGPINPMDLANSGSLYFVRPRLNDHIASRSDLLRRAESLFQLWAADIISVKPQEIYTLRQAGMAQNALEARQSIGKSILRVAQ